MYALLFIFCCSIARLDLLYFCINFFLRKKNDGFIQTASIGLDRKDQISKQLEIINLRTLPFESFQKSMKEIKKKVKLNE